MFKIELFICIKMDLALITYNGWCAIKPNQIWLLDKVIRFDDVTNQLYLQAQTNSCVFFNINMTVDNIQTIHTKKSNLLLFCGIMFDLYSSIGFIVVAIVQGYLAKLSNQFSLFTILLKIAKSDQSVVYLQVNWVDSAVKM